MVSTKAPLVSKSLCVSKRIIFFFTDLSFANSVQYRTFNYKECILAVVHFICVFPTHVNVYHLSPGLTKRDLPPMAGSPIFYTNTKLRT